VESQKKKLNYVLMSLDPPLNSACNRLRNELDLGMESPEIAPSIFTLMKSHVSIDAYVWVMRTRHLAFCYLRVRIMYAYASPCDFTFHACASAARARRSHHLKSLFLHGFSIMHAFLFTSSIQYLPHEPEITQQTHQGIK